MRNLIITDIDHTLSEAHWRDSMIATGDWPAYHAASIDDAPIVDMCNLINGLMLLGYKVIGQTSRDERWRGLTLQWFLLHHVNVTELLMRPNGDFRPACEIKIEQALALCAPNEPKDEIAFVIDDCQEVIDAYRAINVNVMQVYARNDRHPRLTNEQRAQRVLEACYSVK